MTHTRSVCFKNDAQQFLSIKNISTYKQNLNFTFYLYKKISIIYPFKTIGSLVTQKLSSEPLILIKWDQTGLNYFTDLEKHNKKSSELHVLKPCDLERGHPFNTYAKFIEKLTFLTP